MTDHKIEFAERLNKILDDRKLPMRGRAVELAKIFEITPKAAGKWLNGEAFPETGKIIDLATRFNCSVEWLLTGLDSDTVWRNDQNVELSRVAPVRYAPVLSWVQAGAWTTMDDVLLTGDETQYPLVLGAGKRSFYLEVKGESNAPEFKDGELICIDPDYQFDDVFNGEMVVVQWGNTATFKALIVEPNGLYLKPLNVEWSPQIIEIPDGATLVGKYVGSYKPPKRFF